MLVVAVAGVALGAEPIDVRPCAERGLALPADTEQAMGAVLLIEAGGRAASAVVVSPDGFAVTAAHVVDKERVVSAQLRSGERIETDVLRVATASDLALLHVRAAGPLPCLPVAAERAVLGSDLYALGSPGGELLSFSIAKGIVSGYRDAAGVALVQTDASVNPGNSGGPFVDAAGAVVGIVSFKLADVDVEGLSFGVVPDQFDRVLGLRWAAASVLDPVSHAWVDPPPPADASARSAITPSHQAGDDGAAKAALIVGGSATAIVGGVVAGATWGGWRTNPDVTVGEWEAMKAGNAVGWLVGVTGLSMLIGGIAL